MKFRYPEALKWFRNKQHAAQFMPSSTVPHYYFERDVVEAMRRSKCLSTLQTLQSIDALHLPFPEIVAEFPENDVVDRNSSTHPEDGGVLWIKECEGQFEAHMLWYSFEDTGDIAFISTRPFIFQIKDVLACCVVGLLFYPHVEYSLSAPCVANADYYAANIVHLFAPTAHQRYGLHSLPVCFLFALFAQETIRRLYST